MAKNIPDDVGDHLKFTLYEGKPLHISSIHQDLVVNTYLTNLELFPSIITNFLIDYIFHYLLNAIIMIFINT